MTDVVVSTQEMTPQTALYHFADAVGTRKQVQITPREIVDEIQNVCIDLRLRIEQLPEMLQELHKEAKRRIQCDDRYDFVLDGVRRSIASAITDTAR